MVPGRDLDSMCATYSERAANYRLCVGIVAAISGMLVAPLQANISQHEASPPQAASPLHRQAAGRIAAVSTPADPRTGTASIAVCTVYGPNVKVVHIMQKAP